MQSDCLLLERSPALAEAPAPGKPAFADTTFVRFVAIALVVNSHLESLYPHHWMAADGTLGDKLFCAVSGLNLMLSPLSRQMGFAQWLWRRITRLYPSFLLVLLFFVVLSQGTWRHWTPIDYFHEFIWPTRYTFFRTILFCYVALYLGMKANRSWVFPALMGVTAAIMAAFWLPDFRSMPPDAHLSLGTRSMGLGAGIRFLAIFLGAWMATRPQRDHKSMVNVIAVTVMLAAYIGVKYTMIVSGHWARFYPVLYIQVLVLVVLVFRLGHHRWAIYLTKECGALSRFISWVAGMTLEIYLIHEFVADSRWIQGLKFPYSLVGLAVGTLLLSAVFSRIARFLRKNVLNRNANVRWPALSAPMR